MKKTLDSFAHLNGKRLIAPLVCSVGLLVLNDAQAASLGKMKVLSSLGGAFNAEIELLNVAPEEEANLIAKIATPEVFKRAGLEYNPALAGIKATINKDVRPFKIMLHSNATVSEPLLEMLMDLNWQSGRLVRQYTVLLDPIPPIEDVPAPMPAVQVATSQATQQTPAPVSAPAALIDNALPKKNTQPETVEPKTTKAANVAALTAQQYAVKKGDTLYSIANGLIAGNPQHINRLMSLLVKNNPNSFINQDKNRLKSGVVLNTNAAASFADKPSTDTAVKPVGNTAASKAFSQYKQAAASRAKTKTIKDTSDSKLVRSSVKNEVAKPVATSQDQLKVSGKAALGNKALPAAAKSDEAKIAQDRAIAEQKTKLATLKTNIEKSVGITNTALANATTVTTPTTVVSKPTAAPVLAGVAATVAATALATHANTTATTKVPPTTVAIKPAEPVTAQLKASDKTNADITPVISGDMSNNKPTTTTITTDATVAAVNKPETIKPATAVVTAVDGTVNNVSGGIDGWALGGIAGLLGLLGGAWYYFKRKNVLKNQEFSDSMFNLNNTQGSMLTADGGQAVDTFNSVFASSFSEMNMPDSAEVDPVAEADVYMQYGRDAHAEDILKDALKQNPDRLPVHLKLMELYASKNNQVALQEHFEKVSSLTNSNGKDWLEAKKIVNQAHAAALDEQAHPNNVSAASVANQLKTSPLPPVRSTNFATTVIKRPNANANYLPDGAALETSAQLGTDLNQTSTLLRHQLPSISLSAPTQIGDVPTTFAPEFLSRSEAKANKAAAKPSMNVAASDTPLKLDKPVSLLASKVAAGTAAAAGMASLVSAAGSDALEQITDKADNALNFNIQTPTLFSPQTGISSPKNSVVTDVDLSPLTYQPIELPDLDAVKAVDNPDTSDTAALTPASMLDFKISKMDLTANSIFDKISGDAKNAAEIDDDAKELAAALTVNSTQAIETKFSLAKAYIEIGDKEGAKELLHEVLESGHDSFAAKAKQMLENI
jgi:pilus assembly protein FimV